MLTVDSRPSASSSVFATVSQVGTSAKLYWRLLSLLISRELKVKYRGSFLGYLWSMLNPLLFMLIITFVFRRLIKGVENYEIYVLCGVLFWNMTSMSIVGATHSLVSNAGLLRKVRVPYWIFIFVPIGAAAANFTLAMIPFAVLAMVKGISLSPALLAAPILMAVYAVFLAGLGTILAVANVYFRDVAHVVEPVLQLTFYATPIIFDRHNAALPTWVSTMIGFNPFAHFVDLVRATLMSANYFSWTSVAVAGACAAVSAVVGSYFYRHFVAKLSFKI